MRRTVPLALGGLFLAMLGVSPARAATSVTLTVRIDRVFQIENPDSNGTDGDYFPEVRIGDGPLERRDYITGDDFRPGWQFTQTVSVPDGTSTVPILIRLWDDDSAFTGGDDKLDISPVDQDVDLDLVYDINTDTWSGDVPNSATIAQGDGDADFPGTNDGKKARIDFTVSRGGSADIDGDGIPDAIERFGVRNPDGSMVADLAALGADPCRKSIVMQIDYMNGAADGHTHQPKAAAIAEVQSAFNAAPLPAVTPCPYAGTHQATGMDFVYIPGQAIPEQRVMGLDDGYRAARKANFNGELRPYAHYALFVHDQAAGKSSSGLCCESTQGNKDILISLGSWGGQGCVGTGANGTLDTAPSGDDVITDGAKGSIDVGPDLTCNTTASGDDGQSMTVGQVLAIGTPAANNVEVGNVRDQSGSIMHELGHALGLGHGGLDATNYKPNYLSVMNYKFDPAGIPTGPPPAASRLDYSRSALPNLDKTKLVEAAGIGDGTDITNWTDPAGKSQFGAGNVALDWNANKATDAGTVNVNVNPNDDDAAKASLLKGYDDWNNLKFRAVDSPNASGASAVIHGPDIDFVTALAQQTAFRDYYDPDLATTKTVDKADALPGDSLGYTVHVANVGKGTAASIALTDTFPDSTTSARTLADLDAGQSKNEAFSYTVPCTATDGTSLTNRASVTAKNVGGGPEVNTTNNQGSVGTTIHAPHLTLTKSVASSANAGEAFTTTLSVANTGTGSATSVVLTDDLPVGVYYSTALDLGSGPRPTSVLRKSDGTTTLTWNLGSVAGGAATSTSFTARSTLLAVAGTALADSAAASYQNSNGCVYVPATAAGSTSITEVRPTRDPLTAGYWKQHAEARTAELLARVQATDQRFDGADGSTPDGVLSSAEALTILSAGGNQPGPVKAQLLAVLFDLASRRINARTAIGSPLSNGLGLRTVGDAVRYAFGTLAQPVTTATARRYNDTTTVLERITAGQIEVY